MSEFFPVLHTGRPDRWKTTTLILTVLTTVFASILAALQTNADIRAATANRDSQSLACSPRESCSAPGLVANYEFSLLVEIVKDLQTSTIFGLTALEQQYHAARRAAPRPAASWPLPPRRALNAAKPSPRCTPMRATRPRRVQLPGPAGLHAGPAAGAASSSPSRTRPPICTSYGVPSADAYVTVLTVLAVAFFLFGLAQTVQALQLQRFFVLSGALILGGTILWAATIACSSRSQPRVRSCGGRTAMRPPRFVPAPGSQATIDTRPAEVHCPRRPACASASCFPRPSTGTIQWPYGISPRRPRAWATPTSSPTITSWAPIRRAPGGSSGPYTHEHSFLEPFVLFAYMAAATTSIELTPGVLILPQRQTALVAKQAATLDVLSGGRIRLGVGLGWNPVEYQALGEDFHVRGRRLEEQVELLRRLWTEPLVTFAGQWHTIADAGSIRCPSAAADPTLVRRLGRSGHPPRGAPGGRMDDDRDTLGRRGRPPAWPSSIAVWSRPAVPAPASASKTRLVYRPADARPGGASARLGGRRPDPSVAEHDGRRADRHHAPSAGPAGSRRQARDCPG